MKHDFVSATLNRENGKRCNKTQSSSSTTVSFLHSRTSTNGHLSTLATFFVPAADSPYIVYCLSLATTATATKACPQLPKYPLNNGQFFQRLMKKSRMVMKFDRMAR